MATAACHISMRCLVRSAWCFVPDRTAAAIVAGLALGACSPAAERQSDRAFAALQQRGASPAAMGVDQYTSSHVFESLPDGGRIVLQRDTVDRAGTATIRAHMRDIAVRFAAGDFSIPGLVHAQTVPGTIVMAARRHLITYTPDTLPRGGQVRILARDSVAVAAIHEFLAFQRADHRVADHARHKAKP